MSKFSWNIDFSSKKSYARNGRITTPHGIIETPAFIFCGTKAALKSISTNDAKINNTQIILSNTYHLMLQPGSKVIAKHGGLHKFMNWEGPILTDSGGFQIFSLGYGSVADEIKGKGFNSKRKKTLLNISEEGTLFKSYIDGKKVYLTPEKSIEIQRDLGADLILVFDECTPFHSSKKYISEAMQRSHRWAKRSLNRFNSKILYNSRHGSAGLQQMYGIIQGGIHEDLREESISFNLNNINTFGLAIGGSLGSTKNQMYKVVNYTARKLGKKHPVHLLGIGDPSDIWNLVKDGVDTFDCVSPTRLARHGSALARIKEGKININNSEYELSTDPIDKKCGCFTCKNYSLAYLNHLFKSGELLGLQLLTAHNIYFMNFLMKTIRDAIKIDKLVEAEVNWYN